MSGAPVILVAEDEDLLQGILEDALTEAGFETEIVSSAEEALTLVQAATRIYKALVCDVMLKGGLNGWHLARRIRETDGAFPVVYITGAAAQEWPSLGVPNSVLLVKPFAPAQLITAISQLLNIGTPASTTGNKAAGT